MHDINDKTLNIGSEVHVFWHGLCRIVAMREDHNDNAGGALIRIVSHKTGVKFNLRTHQDRVILVRSWKELAEEALQIQNACNLSGVVKSFSHVIQEVRARLESEGKTGTDQVNAHPVCQLFADKIASLTGTQSMLRVVVNAYAWARGQIHS